MHQTPIATGTSTVNWNFSNTGTVTSDGTSDPNGANNTSAAVTTTVQENVVLSVSKNFNSATVTAGGASKTFTVSVTNSGFSDADNLSLTDTVDSRLIVEAGLSKVNRSHVRIDEREVLANGQAVPVFFQRRIKLACNLKCRSKI